jgi:hypothetical protein
LNAEIGRASVWKLAVTDEKNLTRDVEYGGTNGGSAFGVVTVAAFWAT